MVGRHGKSSSRGAQRLTNWKDLAPFTILWAVIAVILDAIFLVPFSGWALYASWSVWVGYALVAIIPLVTSFWRRGAARPN